MGEIKLKDNKYYFIPIINDITKEANTDDLFSWLIYRGMKYPSTKNGYRIREGDVIKIGRMWLIVRAIHLPLKKYNDKRLDIIDTDCMISHHQGNQSLNVKDDFKEDKMYGNLYDDSDDDSSDKSDNNNNDKNNKIINLIDEEKNNKNKGIKYKINEKKKKKGKNNKNNKQKICRICYLEEDNPSLNPLIRPCKCSGSMKYIHLKCLIIWIKTKVEIDNSEYLDNGKYTVYSCEDIECELCKEVFPNYIKHNNKLYNLMDLEQYFGEENNQEYNNNNNKTITEEEQSSRTKGKQVTENSININNKNKKNKSEEEESQQSSKLNIKKDPYIVLDSISLEKNSPTCRYIAKFSNNVLKIGRGIDMDLIMNDLSISRNHCHLELNDDGEILLKDYNSKFGTLILIQAKKIEILQNQTLTIQVGRSYFNINNKSNSSIFGCCKADEIDLSKSYEKINFKAVKFDKLCVIKTESDNDDSDKEENDEIKNKDNENEKALKKANNKNKERIKTYENNENRDEIESKVEYSEKNNTFINENINKDF